MTEQDINSYVTVEKVDRCGSITLNRPGSLNALTHEMVDKIESFYMDCLKDPHIYGLVVESTDEKAFCAGADVRALLPLIPDNADMARSYIHAEFQHNWTLEQYNKPNIPLIDGIVMGGGAGISIYGTHCIMGENTRFAMPEVSIGFFPDIGSSFYMSRLKGCMGLYLMLTGRTIGAADCLYLGLATHTIPREKFREVKDAMINADPIDPVVATLSEDFGESELAGLQDVVDRVFSGNSLTEVIVNLDQEAEDGWSKHSDWARETEDLLREKCPLSLKIAFLQYQKARTYTTMKQALVTDMRIASRMVLHPDFSEGVRAVLIDKTKPKWTHEAIEDVSDEEVEQLFAALENEPEFKDLEL